jgi:histidyl-tRNA synthetase
LIGGPKTPACGFALYIEPLADLIQPETGKATGSEIIIRCEASTAAAIKTSFKLAGALRQAGLAAVLDFDGRQQGQCQTVIVRDAASFITIDPSRNLKKEASSIAEVVKTVGGPA